MGTLDYCLIAVYFVATLGLGWFVGTGQKTIKDFFHGDRSIPWWAAMCSGVATIVSGVSYLGSPGLAFSTNYNWLQFRLAVPFALLIICCILLPLFYKMGVYSIYEYLERRFDRRTRLLSACMFVFLKCGYLSVVIYASSLVLAEIVPLPFGVITITVGMVTALYTLVGGIKAVIWTDTLQLGVFVGGIIATISVVLSQVDGGVSTIIDIADRSGRLDFFNFSTDWTQTYTFWGCVFGGMFMIISQFGTDQAEIQRYLTTRTARDANVAMIFSHLALVVVGFGLFFIGTALFAFYSLHPEKGGLESSANRIYAKFIVEEMPVGMKGLLVGAVLAASMSTISSVLNSLATVTLADLVPAISKRTPTLASARWITLVFGGITTGLACFGGQFGNLLDASNRIINLFGGSLVGTFLLGTLCRNANAPGAFWGLILGTIAVVALEITTEVSFMWFGPFSAGISFFGGLLISSLWRLRIARP
ncbi:MAG TPA: sodium/solute symporter [Opitutaceae bacterium]|nr:sodium/solute symporter [Opitutaceae bacterium]